MDSDLTSVLLLLELSVTFDTVENYTLLECLEDFFGLEGVLLAWRNRTKFCYILDLPDKAIHGVLHGSIFGLLLFYVYILPLGHIFKKKFTT